MSFIFFQKRKKISFIKKKSSLKRNGFTMIELLLVVAIMGLVSGFSVPIYQSFLVKNDLDTAIISISQQIKRAQSLSVSGLEDSLWGIKLETGKAIIFKGSDFSSRDILFDEIFEIPKSISISGVNEIIFSKLYGNPSSFGVITLTSVNSDSRDIIINQKGVVDY